MADAEDPRASIFGSEPGGESIESVSPVADGRLELVVCDFFAGLILDGEPRRGAYTFDLTSRFQPPASTFRPLEYAKLQARRTSVEYKCIVIH
jgi:hypothetical protein